MNDIRLVRNPRPPKPLNLRGGAALVIKATQAQGGRFRLEMSAVASVYPGGPRKRQTLDTRVYSDEAAMWLALQSFAASKLVDVAECEMDAPEPEVAG